MRITCQGSWVRIPYFRIIFVQVSAYEPHGYQWRTQRIESRPWRHQMTILWIRLIGGSFNTFTFIFKPYGTNNLDIYESQWMHKLKAKININKTTFSAIEFRCCTIHRCTFLSFITVESTAALFWLTVQRFNIIFTPQFLVEVVAVFSPVFAGNFNFQTFSDNSPLETEIDFNICFNKLILNYLIEFAKAPIAPLAYEL